jgi:hypothetical protein
MLPAGAAGEIRSELLLEPVMCVRLVVVRLDLDEPGRLVEADRLDQGLVGLQPNRTSAMPRRMDLQLGQQPTPDPDPRTVGRSSAISVVAVAELQPAPASWLAPQRRDSNAPASARSSGHACRDAQLRIETGLEPLVQLGEYAFRR